MGIGRRGRRVGNRVSGQLSGATRAFFRVIETEQMSYASIVIRGVEAQHDNTSLGSIVALQASNASLEYRVHCSTLLESSTLRRTADDREE